MTSRTKHTKKMHKDVSSPKADKPHLGSANVPPAVHPSHRLKHRTFRTVFLICVLLMFFILFGIFSKSDIMVGLFLAFICGVGCIIIYELMIIPKMHTMEMKENSAHQVFIGLVAMTSAFISLLAYSFLNMTEDNLMLLMTVLTLALLFITMPLFDRHVHKLVR